MYFSACNYLKFTGQILEFKKFIQFKYRKKISLSELISKPVFEEIIGCELLK